MILLRNNGLRDEDIQTVAAALLNPACNSICGLDLGFNQLGPEVPLLLLPLLHQPPQMVLQARRRSTAGAAEGHDSLLSCGKADTALSASANTACVTCNTFSVAARADMHSQGAGSTICLAGACPPQAAAVAAAAQEHGMQGAQGPCGIGSSQVKGQVQQSNAGLLCQLTSEQSLPGVEHAVLQQLVLCSNHIGDTGAEVLCKVVASGDCWLQLLDLSGCGITESLSGHLRDMLEGAR